MYKSDKFWMWATIGFAIFTILYAIGNGILSFVTILNGILFIISGIYFINISRKNKKDKKSKKQK